ncbi:MAG: beta-N-acetylhexosaminidase [Candidatus Rokubacteria bacterium]|nr:beta-N-acetylhexosaminidase [Candidatus Rokubacteria bacterium]
MTLEELVGQRLMFGIPGPILRPEDIRLLKETGAGGLILYRRNFESAAQLIDLLTRLEEALRRRLLVATDHEGGRVVMLGEGVTIFPDNLAVGASGEAISAERQGRIEALELRRLGIDLNFAPVLDVLTDAPSPNIGIRSYGKDPALVARLGAARIRGMQSRGLSACAKHFPGKGHSPVDAHLRLPTVASAWDEMKRTHLPPFLAALETGVDALMTSHPLYPALDPTPLTPATFSKLIVKDYLRGELGYRGVIASDDLEMGAIAELCPVGEAAVRAAGAGHDLLLVCHTEAAQRQACGALLDAYRGKRLPLKELEASAERIAGLKAKRSLRFEGGSPRPEIGGTPLAKAIASQAVTLVQPRHADLTRRFNGAVGVIFPRFSSLADRITVEPALLDETAYLRAAFALFGVRPEILIVGIEPTDPEIERAVVLAARADIALLFLFDAHLYPSNRRLLDRLQETARALAVALLRNPYDAAYLRPGGLGVTAFGFRTCQLDAIIARLLA